MQADYELYYSFMNAFQYDELKDVSAEVTKAVAWAEAKIEAQTKFLNTLYYWR